ncbi:alpha/beta fold hydrolase [Bacillus lacus]|uniref:Alpha/beta fold hydrolase n=1 Tax=Metabacillus lacus TaxID=1983721 RepID=A0A7X2IYQ5_9BACI|nr:alpha/beta fold hydrolase [Metabacillus lacus]MRX72099.1 alpha/beta fold hydrolase [Metabacillus lacus]
MAGCLCIHGFTGAPYEVEPLAVHLQKKTDWEIIMPTLPGHGEELSLKGILFNEWIQEAEKELQSLLKRHEEVYVIGFSMGGLIAAYLTSKYPVSKLVLLSAAAYYVNPKQFLSDISALVRDWRKGKITDNELFHRYKSKITKTPISATLQFRKLVKYIKPHLANIKVPVLIVQGECDGIVPVKSAHFLFQTVGSSKKELCLLPCSKHHVCHGEDFPRLVEEVDKFLIEKR